MLPRISWLAALLILSANVGRAETAAGAKARVHSLKITILSTMLADGPELGEWGFSALVDVEGHRILFDTGAHTDVVQKNVRSMGIDLGTVPDVILSHSHSDHVGGFLTLRQSVISRTPGALARTHVGAGIFYPRPTGLPGVESNPLLRVKPEYEQGGGVFIVHERAEQLYPGIWLTGPVPRIHPERNWSGGGKMATASGVVEDNLPEDMALIIDTDQGLVVLTGCGHAGVINIIDYARTIIRPARVHALIGGIHLFAATEETLRWTVEKLKSYGVDNIIGAHCTGLETVYRFRHELSLDRAHAVVGAVGANFELGPGIDPRAIAR
ncbi:MAG: MBL fold metallo-hydrolase [Opitutaceae bacterium]|nr:MBL fold metallo-hydrolase [Opitutaceae bacterium]